VTALLDDKDEGVRARAASALGKLSDAGMDAVYALISAVEHDRDDDVRFRAIVALGQLRDPAAVPVLADQLESWRKPDLSRAQAADALGEIGDPGAVSALSLVIVDKNKLVALSAVDALGKIGDARAIPALRWASQSNSRDSSVAKTLEKLLASGAGGAEDKRPDDARVGKLTTGLEHAHPRIRRVAAEVLGAMKEGRAVPSLLHTLSDSDAEVRLATARALGRIGDPQTIPFLIRAFEDGDKRVRRRVASVLGLLRDPAARKTFVSQLKAADAEGRRDAVRGLSYQLKRGDISPEEALALLLGALRDTDSEVRREAAQTLGWVHGAQAATALAEALKDSDSKVRANAARSLGANPDRSAVSELLVAAGNKDREVRMAAAAALVSLKEPGAVPVLTGVLARARKKEEYFSAFREAHAEASDDGEKIIISLQDLFGLLSSTEPGFRAEGAKFLEAVKRSPRALSRLKEEIDLNLEELLHAALALYKLGEPRPLPRAAILDGLRYGTWDGREYAAQLLSGSADGVVASLANVLLRDDESRARHGAARVLARIGDTAAVDALLIALDDPASEVRDAAGFGLAQSKDPRGVPALCATMREPFSALERAWVATMLGMSGDPRAIPTLVEALGSTDDSLRKSAVVALGKIGDPQALPALRDVMGDPQPDLKSAARQAIEAIEKRNR
jgi:HEAT repeat protein